MNRDLLLAIVAIGLVLGGCGEIPTMPPVASNDPRAPTAASTPGTGTTPGLTTPAPITSLPTPWQLPTLPISAPQPPPIQPTPYALEAALPSDFAVAYFRGGTIWTLRSGNGLLQEQFLASVNPGGQITQVALSPDGRFLAVSAGDW